MDNLAEVEIQELFEIMEVLEVPVTRHYTNLAVYNPPVMPETFEGIQDLMESGIEPRICRRAIGHSLTRNAYNLLMSALGGMNSTGSGGGFGDGGINMKDTGGTMRGMTTRGIETNTNDHSYMVTYANDSNQGIWIGTGNTAETFNDFALDAKIDHGDGAGELRYWEMLEPKKDWDGGTRQWTFVVRRYFTNHSGGSISVAEMALICEAYVYAADYYIVTARDVLGAPIAVGDGELLLAEYELVSSVWPS